MLQFPDAKSGEQEALRSREGADRWQFFLNGLGTGGFAGTTAFRLRLSGATRYFTDWEVASLVNVLQNKQLPSHRWVAWLDAAQGAAGPGSNLGLA